MSQKDKSSVGHVEDIEAVSTGEMKSHQATRVMGTVKLTEGSIVYIPTPTADPQDPLNLSMLRKITILVVISIFSCLGLSLVSGFGGLLGFYIPKYEAAGVSYNGITYLMTYPTLFMGIGNLIGMPLAIGVGRRVVMLVSTAILAVGAILCATAKTYEWHFGARILVGLAAGQSESIVPMISQEIFFLHERSKALMGQQAIQVCLTTVWVLFASPIAEAITPQWWYGLGAVLAGALCVLTFFLLPETKYERSLSAYQEESSSGDEMPMEGFNDGKPNHPETAACTERPELDFVNYTPRTFKSDLRLWIGKPEWFKIWEVLRQTAELLLFPNVLWALLLNGLVIGVNVAIGTTYSTILSGAPYNWPNSSASYINCGQILVAVVALPLLGHGSDWLVKFRAKRNNGLHEPETRLIPLILPAVVGTFTSSLYGEGAAHPYDYHWFVYAWAVAAYYFCFVGVNIVTITYLLDSYPARAGPILVIVCAFRGIISFGTSYGTAPFVDLHGYDGTFNTFAALTGFLGLMGLPIYIWGKRIRAFTGRFAKDKTD
ncbi:major facilitator superfamily domain-containing protein [Aspergillus caelatus]|uniref:Major facilitator superfamily domain-containing protein n=1 Tax=Aspergillus caelatus TaxID=61420 RepID=A0A5N6ZXA6_9EURO|nr:major facilitator superfamily domain-containing protein [Aspergillus caelatus]KAE8362251.1 major facilitator superfamily domain-containing protein [Aspergillus caelatus]